MKILRFSFGLLACSVTAETIACTPPPTEVIRDAADVIVVGTGNFSRAQNGGTIASQRALKGSAKTLRVDIAYSRKPSKSAGVMCPTYELEGRHSGTFYLRRLANGHYSILQFTGNR